VSMHRAKTPTSSTKNYVGASFTQDEAQKIIDEIGDVGSEAFDPDSQVFLDKITKLRSKKNEDEDENEQKPENENENEQKPENENENEQKSETEDKAKKEQKQNSNSSISDSIEEISDIYNEAIKSAKGATANLQRNKLRKKMNQALKKIEDSKKIADFSKKDYDIDHLKRTLEIEKQRAETELNIAQSKDTIQDKLQKTGERRLERVESREKRKEKLKKLADEKKLRRDPNYIMKQELKKAKEQKKIQTKAGTSKGKNYQDTMNFITAAKAKGLNTDELENALRNNDNTEIAAEKAKLNMQMRGSKTYAGGLDKAKAAVRSAVSSAKSGIKSVASNAAEAVKNTAIKAANKLKPEIKKEIEPIAKETPEEYMKRVEEKVVKPLSDDEMGEIARTIINKNYQMLKKAEEERKKAERQPTTSKKELTQRDDTSSAMRQAVQAGARAATKRSDLIVR